MIILWIDYREKLGIGFADDDKFKLLLQKVQNILVLIHKEEDERNRLFYKYNSYGLFCIMIGKAYYEDSDDPLEKIITVLDKSEHIEEFLSLYVAFVNTFIEDKYIDDVWGKRSSYIELLCKQMRESGIPYELLTDDDEFFVFPKGVSDFDDALVSETLDWLVDYPKCQKTFTIALRQYAEGKYFRDTADNFRKALEEFFQEFCINEKNLSNNIALIGAYLKTQGADGEIAKMLTNIVGCYDKLNNNIAKHNDRVDEKFLEFLMYQTGLFIRMLIVVRRAEAAVSNA